MLSQLAAGASGCSPTLLARCLAGSAARYLYGSAARLLHTTTAARSLAAVEKLYKELEGKKALPWENPVKPEEAAKVLGEGPGWCGGCHS